MEINSLLEAFKALFKKKPKDFKKIREDLKKELDKLKKQGIISNLEEKVFLELLRLKELKVRDLLIPRHVLKGLDEEKDWQELKNVVISHPHLYYPVYKKVLDNFTGYISLKDLIAGLDKTDFSWRKYVRNTITLPEHISLFFALEKLLNKNVDIAFVIDEISEFSGMIRLKDILKEIFYEGFCVFPKDKEGWILISGTTKIKDLERCFNLSLPEGNFETISGFIIDKIQRIPSPGERIKVPPFEVEIISSNEKKIDSLKLRIL